MALSFKRFGYFDIYVRPIVKSSFICHLKVFLLLLKQIGYNAPNIRVISSRARKPTPESIRVQTPKYDNTDLTASNYKDVLLYYKIVINNKSSFKS